MNILIHCIHYPVCSGRYAVAAFKRLGHEVYHIGEETGRRIWGIDVPTEYTWSQEQPPDGWQPDLAILMDTAYQWHHESAPTVVWSVDNHVRDLRQDGITHYFLAHKSVSVMDWEHQRSTEDIEFENQRIDVLMPTMKRDDPLRYNPPTKVSSADMTWLPCAYDPVAFPPSPIPWEQRAYDVCMIGVMYPKRWELVNAMRAAGLKVLAGAGLVYEAYRDAYHNSRVALVSSFNGDLPIRLFEGAGMGCAVLCDEIGDFHSIGGQPYVSRIYHTVEEAVQLAQVMQSQPELAVAGAEWAKPHTWDARAQVIIDWVEAQS